MIAALLPVKEFHRSKRRLAGFLSPEQRVALARAMFEDAWAVLREAVASRAGLERLLVVSAEPFVIARCLAEGVACLEEKESVSHSDSVSRATQWAMSLGVTSLLSVPIDTPGMTAEELLALAQWHRCGNVVVVPSSDGSGTNALLRTPPDAIAPHFGPSSCLRHIQEAEEKGWNWRVIRSPGLMADIDTPEDVEVFLASERRGRTRDLLEQWFDIASLGCAQDRRHRWAGSRRGVPAWR